MSYAAEVAQQPYARLAPIYDDVIGKPFLTGLCRAFEQLKKRYDIRFRSAADVGCGTGLFAEYLRRRWGVPVFAVDLSSSMLEIGRKRATPEITYLRQDIRDLKLPRCVDLVTANFDTVNHLLQPADVKNAFQRIAAAIRAGGHFVFDALTPCICRAAGTPVTRKLSTGATVMQQVVGCRPNGLTKIMLVYRDPAGRMLRVSNVERPYKTGDVCDWLQRAGLQVRGIHDASAERGRSPCPARVIFVARKPDPTSPRKGPRFTSRMR